ncbi:hypothetical protein LTR78_008728 [Recurvomyces mirabilis]|uniref:Succinate dehydrogenase assembly factor 3 n=1 Tax=Recurvomyces mirabilis TaxID=574656 RepID=A0AAE0TQ57_9PEZI|nr:hypothetical protein LTR78_008728 [Recurvomyces mirabilis]
MFRHTSRRLATASSLGSTTSSPLRTAPLALLPPIPLYRRLLRAHRKYLPQEMRLLGDEYIKAEFRAHRDTDNPVHIVGFLTEWQLYAQKVEGNNWRGDKMEEGKIGQMYELMLAIRQQELEENDPEYKPHTPPPPPEKE